MNDSARKLAAAGTNQDLSFQECARNFAAENSEIIVVDSKWSNNYHMSRVYVPHLEKVYSNLRQQLKRKPEDKMEDFDVNTLIRKVKQVFDMTRKLVRDLERNPRCIRDRLATKFLENVDSVD